MAKDSKKTERRHPETKRKIQDGDYRSAAEKDRDRLLFSSAFRRLAGVTQVVSVQEGHIFHNRLTHSLKVAQIARSLAHKLLDSNPKLSQALGGIDPAVVETAALAHDLGHPPFGHIAERKLHELAQSKGLIDGFEGNAQSFRIVTQLAIRKENFRGLNLSRASLNAILKYPWMYGQNGKKSEKKWGAYFADQADFEFARVGFVKNFHKSLEAELMDLADDIAYSIHDVEDFYRAGLIPLDRLVGSLDKQRNGSFKLREGSEMERFLNKMFFRWMDEKIQAEFQDQASRVKLEQSFISTMAQLQSLRHPYDGSHHQKANLRNFTSDYVNRYINAVVLVDPEKHEGQMLWMEESLRYEIKVLKELSWHYVMRSPALTAQKKGQLQMIETLFNTFYDAMTGEHRGEWDIFPLSYRERLEETDDAQERTRIVVDLIASMTEAQAQQMYQRLTGTAPGSMLMPIVY